jgi:hypothetical protein
MKKMMLVTVMFVAISAFGQSERRGQRQNQWHAHQDDYSYTMNNNLGRCGTVLPGHYQPYRQLQREQNILRDMQRRAMADGYIDRWEHRQILRQRPVVNSISNSVSNDWSTNSCSNSYSHNNHDWR